MSGLVQRVLYVIDLIPNSFRKSILFPPCYRWSILRRKVKSFVPNYKAGKLIPFVLCCLSGVYAA